MCHTFQIGGRTLLFHKPPIHQAGKLQQNTQCCTGFSSSFLGCGNRVVSTFGPHHDPVACETAGGAAIEGRCQTAWWFTQDDCMAGKTSKTIKWFKMFMFQHAACYDFFRWRAKYREMFALRVLGWERWHVPTTLGNPKHFTKSKWKKSWKGPPRNNPS